MEIKPKAIATDVYLAEVDGIQELIAELYQYRDGCTDADWEIIDNAISTMKADVRKRKAFARKMQKKSHGR